MLEIKRVEIKLNNDLDKLIVMKNNKGLHFSFLFLYKSKEIKKN